MLASRNGKNLTIRVLFGLVSVLIPSLTKIALKAAKPEHLAARFRHFIFISKVQKCFPDVLHLQPYRQTRCWVAAGCGFVGL